MGEHRLTFSLSTILTHHSTASLENPQSLNSYLTYHLSLVLVDLSVSKIVVVSKTIGDSLDLFVI